MTTIPAAARRRAGLDTCALAAFALEWGMADLWQRFQEYFLHYPDIGLDLDISRMRFPDDFFQRMEPDAERAFVQMSELEKGATANPDENRMVGHYWLRAPELAPTADLRTSIEETRERIKRFASDIHVGRIAAPDGRPFEHLLLIGIGGSALGPQLLADALGTATDPMQIDFLDNTDPDGFERVFSSVRDRLPHTLVITISKSGGTKETRNGMVAAEALFKKAGLSFAKHAVAVTGEGSQLHQYASEQGWLERFPMHDWIGGRTSIMSAVGLLPAALMGFDIDSFLTGAAAMDAHTRKPEVRSNAAMLLALMWFHAGEGRGRRDMVILPYHDRLALFSKYLQQLVMESLGKEKDLAGKIVHQGIAVYGNKGSTDQHAYVQQLRDGLNNFFLTFIEVRSTTQAAEREVEPGVTSSDYLQGFFRGTRAALAENGRETMTISIPRLDAFQLGSLIGLYERAVGFYASLVNINAYHQPGVEAGKKAATRLLELQAKVLTQMEQGKNYTAPELAERLKADPEDVFHILRHLAATRANLGSEDQGSPANANFSRER